MSRVASFWLDDNRLTGPIPMQVGSRGTAMGSFWLPREFNHWCFADRNWWWIRMGEFPVHENALSGTIPTEIARLRKIERFMVQVNKLRGTVPTEIGLWSPGPYYSNVQGNQMTGTVPSVIGEIRTVMDNAKFDDNRFAGGTI
jgi:hypothetical protein